MEVNEIMDVSEVAEYLRTTPKTIYNWAKLGILPAIKLGREWRFKKSVIDKWFVHKFDAKFEEYIDEPSAPGK